MKIGGYEIADGAVVSNERLPVGQPRTRMPSGGEQAFGWAWTALGLTPFVTEYQFSARGWRFDFAWPEALVALEVEGGIWTQGRHTRGQGFIDDCEKLNRAAAGGWLVMRWPTPWIDDWDSSRADQLDKLIRARLLMARIRDGGLRTGVPG